MIIIMMGAQGTGKGTVAGIISEHTGIKQLSTGDVFRKNIKEQTPLGIEANKYIAKGNLVPDDITVPMVVGYLDSEMAKDGIILDGFPRTIAQAEKLDEILAQRGKKVDLVINLVTPREEIIERILTRRVCPNCKKTYNIRLNPPKVEGICDNCGSKIVQREDDSTAEAINQRLETYENKTAPLVDYYEQKGVLRTEKVSEKLAYMMKLACDFNNLVYMARVRYNVMLSEGENTYANDEWSRLLPDIRHNATVDLDAVFGELQLINPRAKSFLCGIQAAFMASDTHMADELIRKRERSLKGAARAKLSRTKEFDHSKWVGGGMLDYRFSNARRIVNDIYSGEVSADV